MRALFDDDLAAGARALWRATGPRSATLELELVRTALAGVADLREDVARGQAVARYALQGRTDGDWRTLSRGTTIGYRKLDRFEPVPVRRVRLLVEDAEAAPRPVRVSLHAGA